MDGEAKRRVGAIERKRDGLLLRNAVLESSPIHQMRSKSFVAVVLLERMDDLTRWRPVSREHLLTCSFWVQTEPDSFAIVSSFPTGFVTGLRPKSDKVSCEV